MRPILYLEDEYDPECVEELKQSLGEMDEDELDSVNDGEPFVGWCAYWGSDPDPYQNMHEVWKTKDSIQNWDEYYKYRKTLFMLDNEYELGNY